MLHDHCLGGARPYGQARLARAARQGSGLVRLDTTKALTAGTGRLSRSGGRS
ncbi:hypothetical protein [Streptomyces massasporeus]|uniref:hypothetical protein n=1 Tax=Streptomyces massasporeus TaxID=67324 RepID=UPI00365B4002